MIDISERFMPKYLKRNIDGNFFYISLTLIFSPLLNEYMKLECIY